MEEEGQRVDEDIVINKLLCFNKSAQFCNNEWKTRKVSIEWKINPSCKMFGIFSRDKNNKPFIEIQKLPETLDDTFLVVHEMCHAIRDFDGQTVIFGALPAAQKYKGKELFEMSSMLGSMLDDPLIDLFLQDKYKFNPAQYYINVLIPEIANGLELYGDPTHQWYIFKKALHYAQLSLQCGSIKDASASDTWNKLKEEQYKIRRPKVAKIGEDLYSMSNKNGYDDIEKQHKLFNKIFNKYKINSDKLSDILCVVKTRR